MSERNNVENPAPKRTRRLTDVASICYYSGAMSIKLYRRRYMRALLAMLLGGLIVLGAAAPSAPAQGTQQASAPVQLLLVDETRTLQASLLVNVMAAALQRTGLFEIEAVFANVESSFDDPLGENSTDRVYEMVVIVPREEELQNMRQIWIATCPITHETRPEIAAGVRTIQRLLDERSQGLVKALSVLDDALPGYFASLFEKHGWLEC